MYLFFRGYYVQAHLHWFGYYPELRGQGNNPSNPIPDGGLGFPGFHADGKWGNKSKNAYKKFLEDVGTEGNTGWSENDDILREADIELIRSKCSEVWNRPNFNYYLDYRIRSGNTTRFRPFIFRGRDENLPSDNALEEIIQDEGACTLRDSRCGNHDVDAKTEPIELDSLPDNITWPIRTTYEDIALGDNENTRLSTDELPMELRNVTGGGNPIEATQIQNKYPLYKYNQNRWRICYRGENNGSNCVGTGPNAHDHMKRSGRRFDGQRRNLDTNVLERMHGAVDLFGNYGDSVKAIAYGRIVSFDKSAPISTCFLFIYHPHLVWIDENDEQHTGVTINYGEVHHESLIRRGLMVGDEVSAGQVIGAIGRMSDNNQLFGSMTHFETYSGIRVRWNGVAVPGGTTQITNLHGRLNPTQLLIAIRQRESDRMP